MVLALLEFATFLIQNGIKHITSPPYHPTTNGLAERAVQIVKKGLKKEISGTMEDRIAKLLMAYRTTPQSTTGVSPAELLLGRKIRTKLDMLKPNFNDYVEQQKNCHDSNRTSGYSIGEVYVRGFGTGPKWLPATIEETTGPVSYLVRLEDQRLVRHHQVHLRKRKMDHNLEAKEGDKPEAPNDESDGNNIDSFADFTTPEWPDSNISQSQSALGTSQPSGSQNTDHSGSSAQVCAPTKTPSRLRRCPDYYINS